MPKINKILEVYLSLDESLAGGDKIVCPSSFSTRCHDGGRGYRSTVLRGDYYCDVAGVRRSSSSIGSSDGAWRFAWQFGQVCFGVVDDCQQVDDHVCACDLCACMLMWIYVYTTVCTSQLMYSIVDHAPFLLLVTHTLWSWPRSVARRDGVLSWALIDAE